jgi:hypothetical protein
MNQLNRVRPAKMDETACLAYDRAVEELRAQEYPMLQGELTIPKPGIKAYIKQGLRILTMLEQHSTPNR